MGQAEAIKKAMTVLFQSGMNDLTGGNISVLDSGKMTITSKGLYNDDIKAEDIIELQEGDGNEWASRDLIIHRAIYGNTAAKAIVHCHPKSAMALSLTENKILPQDAKGQSAFPFGLSIVKPRQVSDKDELSKAILSNMNPSPSAVVVKGYGIFTYASSLREALDLAFTLELSSDIWLKSKLINNKPEQRPSQHQHYEQRKRSAIPPSIGVMDRRTVSYRRDLKR